MQSPLQQIKQSAWHSCGPADGRPGLFTTRSDFNSSLRLCSAAGQ